MAANEPRCVIPSTFKIILADFREINFSLNGFNAADKSNENYGDEAGSCTQEPRVYSFFNDEIGFNVIDIPGIGDTRGLFQDAKNIRRIIEKLNKFSEIHGVFILIKAIEPRLTTEVQYNLNETLMMLHANAVPNINFVITHTRSYDYNPGSAMNTLKKYVANLKENNGLTIELNQDKVFCVDNEAFIFQCGWNKSVEYRNEFGDSVKNFSTSWNFSREMVFKLFKQMYTLRGHDVKLTCTVGQARTIIHCIIGPLAMITTLIHQAMLPRSREKNIQTLMKSGEQTEEMVETTKIPPQTVCTSARCIEAIPLPGTTQYNFNFKTVCHAECFLKNVALAKFPEPALEDCQAFDLEGNCMLCGCRVERHMHIKQKQLHQQNIKKVSTKPLSQKEAEEFMDHFVKSQQKEKDQIIRAVVRLSSYLRQNAILEYNNAFKERMNVEIRKEQAALERGSQNSTEVIKKLEKTLEDYLTEMTVIDISIKNGDNEKVTEEDIRNILQNLFTLQHNGANIRKLYDAERSECLPVPDFNAFNPHEIVHCKVNFIPGTDVNL
uniref:AIG1-type G domain-containing protein n=1 Tax=Panagrolaimus sp. ES5 TaxID=591445 RepID=A0AC34EZN5_9BILA